MISQVRTNTGDAGYFKLAKETSYAQAVAGGRTQAIIYNQGSPGLQVATETVPRRGIAGLGSMEGVQLRQRIDGGHTLDMELNGHAAPLLGLYGAVETLGAGPYDNCFYSVKELPTWNLDDHWPGNTVQEAAGENTLAAYLGMAFNQQVLTLTGGDPMTAEYTLLGGTVAALTSVPVLLNPKPYAPIKPQEINTLTWYGLDLLEVLHSFALTTNNNGREDIYPGGLAYRQKMFRGDGGMMVEFTADMYADDNYSNGSTGIYDRFLANGAPGPLHMIASSADGQIVVYVPELRATGQTLGVTDQGAQIVTVTGVAEVGLVPFSDNALFPVIAAAGQGTDRPGQMIGVMYSNEDDASAL